MTDRLIERKAGRIAIRTWADEHANYCSLDPYDAVTLATGKDNHIRFGRPSVSNMDTSHYSSGRG